MRLQLVTPERLVVDTEVEEVYAPGVEGQFGVLPQHTQFLTALEPGELRYRENGRDHYVAVSGGALEVVREVVTVLADAAEPADEIDVERARRAEQHASEVLRRVAPDSPEGREAKEALARAESRRAVAQRAA